GRGDAAKARRGGRSGRLRRPRPDPRRSDQGRDRAGCGGGAGRGGDPRVLPRAAGQVQGADGGRVPRRAADQRGRQGGQEAADRARVSAVVVEDADGVRTLTLNRPDRLNAIDTETRRLLNEELRRADADDGVRCIVLTGACRAFSAGADLKEEGPVPHG